MALKKPSDFFGKNNSNKVDLPTGTLEIPEKFDAYKSNVKNIETLNEFTDTFGSFRENISKIDLLETTIEELKEEISKSLSQEDLDNAMMSNLLILEDNIKKIESNLKGINRKDLSAIYEEVEDITKKVSYVFEQELPKYKSIIKNNEIYFDKKLISYQETVDEKLEDFIDDFQSQIQDKFVVLKNELEGINEQSLSQINSNVNELTELVHQELPKYKKQVVDNSLKTEERIASVYETLEEYQKEVYERVEIVQKSFHNLIEQEVPKYQELLLSAKISNDEKIEAITEEFVSKINSLTENAQKLNEDVQEKSESLESSFKDKVSSLESHILTTKKDLEETAATYKKLYQAIEAKGLSDKRQFESQEIEIEKISNNLKDSLIEVNTLKNSFDDETIKNELQHQEIVEFKKNFYKKLNLLENDIIFKDKKLKTLSNDLTEEVASLSKKFKDLNVSDLKEKYSNLSNKISYIEEVFDKFNEKTLLNEGLLNEPPNVKNSDPLTQLDKNYVTLDQLNEHYRLFINRVQQQLSTLGGGGEVRLEFLDDVDSSAKVDGKYLKYDSTSGKWIGADVSGGGGGSSTELIMTNGSIVSGIATTNTIASTEIDTFSATSYRSAKYQIQITNALTYQSTEINLIHDDTVTYLTEYGTLKTGESLVTFDSDISGSLIRLLVSPTYDTTTTIKFIRTLINQ